ncbi:MAG: glucose-6-phosphate dehydrogenase [Candidatus Gracilibacteria bacterium]
MAQKPSNYQSGIPFQKAESDFTLIIFGASGSLARLKLFPSLYQLHLEKRTPKDFKIVGYARTEMSQEGFKDEFRQAVRAKFKTTTDEKILESVVKNVSYVSGNYDNEMDYGALEKHLSVIEKKNNKRIRMAYLSTPPSVFEAVIKQLGKAKLDTSLSKLRLIVEKPFGYDLASAKHLEGILLENFQENQFFLLDHYLGKEAVFNLLSLRYANPILTSLIRGEYISNIQINGLEKFGTEGRASYFDHVGSVRDMVQSHLFQILAFLTMDLPEQITCESVHRAKRNLIESLHLKDKKTSIILGQYKGYAKEPGVKEKSKTETFAAIRLFIDNLNWHNVPVYMRTGKKMKEQLTSVVIEFKPQPLQKGSRNNLEPNKLIIQLQPFEKIEFNLLTKMGGSEVDFVPLNTGKPIYCSGDCLDEHSRLLLEVIKGEKMLFLEFSEIYAAWNVVDQITKSSENGDIPLRIYEPGTFGPKEASKMLEDGSHTWHDNF